MLGSSSSPQGLLHGGSSLLAFGFGRFEPLVLVLDLAHLELSLFLQSFSCPGFMPLIFGMS